MLKRNPVKYIRDKAKAGYTQKYSCEICSSSNLLELHHYNSISELVSKYVRQYKLKEEDVLIWRDTFIEFYNNELYVDVVTLCKSCHEKLHSIYGQHPDLSTAKLQSNWVAKQKEKYV